MKIEIRQGLIATSVSALTVAVFLFDILTPRGLANQVLYVIPLLISFLSTNRTFPFVVAGVCSLLTFIGLILSPDVFQIPLWVVASNRVFSLVIIWTPILYYYERRKHEEALKQMNAELELRVQSRTIELASVNEALVVEISERMQTERMLNTSRQELRTLAAQLLRVQEEERRRISRDLHDDINQRLAILVMEVEALERELSAPSTSIGRALRSIHDHGIELSEDIRHLAYQFHPSILDDLGFPIALQRLIDDFTARTGIKGHVTQDGMSKSLSQEIATCLYRIAQESLSNVSRHANASHVDIDLSGVGGAVQMTITDNGMGFDPEQSRTRPRGLGLISMKERIALVDGTLNITSCAGKGTQIRARVPFGSEGT